MTTTPSMCTECSRLRIASTAAWSAASLSPRPTSRAAASAAYSVTRTSSSARLRSSRVADRVVAPSDISGRPLDDPGRLARALGGRGAHRGAQEHEQRSEQRDEDADTQADEARHVPGLLDERVVADEPERGDRDHGGHLAARPG